MARTAIKPTLVPHAVADLFPLMTGEEFEALKRDIAEHGQLEPITLCDGRILDGRNRYNACCELGIQPTTRQFDDESPVTFVMSANLHRRHLTTSQRAEIGAEILPMLEAEAKERMKKAGESAGRGRPKSTEQGKANSPTPNPRQARDDAAELVGVSPRSISDAKAVRTADPELAQQVREGKVSLNAATQQVKERKESNGKPAKPKRPRITLSEFSKRASAIADDVEALLQDLKRAEKPESIAFDFDEAAKSLRLARKLLKEVSTKT